MRLVDVDEALRLFGEDYEKTKELIHNGESQLDSLAEGFTEAHHIIKYVLPTVDAVPVVRCKDCKHRTEYGNCGHPRQKGVLPSAYPFDFCSYGDRRVDHLALEAETTQIIDGCCTACGAFMDCCEAAEYKFCPYCAKRIV